MEQRNQRITAEVNDPWEHSLLFAFTESPNRRTEVLPLANG